MNLDKYNVKGFMTYEEKEVHMHCYLCLEPITEGQIFTTDKIGSIDDFEYHYVHEDCCVRAWEALCYA